MPKKALHIQPSGAVLPTAWPPSGAGLRTASLGTVIMGLLFVGGCSYVPDALNPIEWYKDTVNLFTDDDVPDETAERGQPPLKSGLVADRAAPPPGGDQPYPNLGTVPPRPRASSPAERQQAVQALTAPAPRQYATGTGTRQAAAASTLQPAAPPPPAQPMMPMAAPAPVSPQAAQMAAAAPPPPQLQMRPSSIVEETYRARLAQRRPGGEFVALGPANAAAPVDQPFRTVIVSSNGVELGNPVPTPDYERSGFFAQGSGPSGKALRVATILFPNGSARLSSTDRSILRKVYVLHRRKGGKVRIIGHASSRTRNLTAVKHKMVNFNISVSRADAIAKELMRLGVKRADILVGARADTEPMYYEVMPSGEAGNRRAEIYLES